MNIREIKKQYPFLQKWSDTHAWELYKKIQPINEFLKTIDSTTTITQLQKQIGPKIKVSEANNSTIDIEFDILDKDILNRVNKFMETYGWYPSFIGGYTKNAGKYSSNLEKFIGKKNVDIKYEAKYGKEDEFIRKNPTAFHITSNINLPKILKYGLTPKTKSKLSNHPERIYLVSNVESDELEELAQALWKASSNKDSIESMYILEIDLSKIPNHKFYDDPNFFMGDGAFTEQNIPPSAIEVLYKINQLYL